MPISRLLRRVGSAFSAPVAHRSLSVVASAVAPARVFTAASAATTSRLLLPSFRRYHSTDGGDGGGLTREWSVSDGPMTDTDVNSRTEGINELFVTARDEIEFAEESMGRSYYDDDAKLAMEAVAEAREAFAGLSAELSARNGEDDASKLQRSVGLKMERSHLTLW